MDEADRLKDIEPFRVMAILARARAMEAAGRDIIHMEVGEPDFPTPAAIVDAGIAALRRGETHYTPALGLPALRQAIADHYRECHGVAITPERVAVTPGASGALLLAMAALFNPGDEILLTDPGYPCNRQFARLLDVRGRGIPVGPETGFQLSAESVASHWGPRTRGVLLANPGNPTGTALSRDALHAIHAVVRERGGVLLVDEIYHALVYEDAPPTALTLGDDVVVINSFSKYFLMTGWRLGWLVVPEGRLSGIDRLAQNLFLAPVTMSQHAALVALKASTRVELEHCKAELRRRRDFLLPTLAELGFRVPVSPQGAFYVYAELPDGVPDAEIFARQVLESVGVAITPGTDFGVNAAHRHVRFAYTTSLERIQEAMHRLRHHLDGGANLGRT